MAVRITYLCISCDVCLGECPTSSIVNAKDNPTDNNYYYVDPATCTECIGDNDSPLCQAACPIDDCIVWDLPFDEAHTLGGLLIEEMENIPVGKCSIQIGPHIMTIVDIRDNVINKVLIKPNRVTDT